MQKWYRCILSMQSICQCLFKRRTQALQWGYKSLFCCVILLVRVPIVQDMAEQSSAAMPPLAQVPPPPQPLRSWNVSPTFEQMARSSSKILGCM